MVVSINNNQSALLALQQLNQTMSDLQTTQARVSTGKRVGKPSDNAAVFSVAQRLRGDQSSFQAVTDSLNRAVSIANVANTAGLSVSDTLNQIKTKIVAATDASLDTTARGAFNTEFKALLRQISQTVQSASFAGSNILNNSITPPGLKFLADGNGTSFVTLGLQNLNLGGGNILITANADLLTVTRANLFLTAINSSINNVSTVLSNLGSQTSQINARLSFISALSDTLSSGISNLVDADIAAESSRLQALQIKQQLGAQALSIANQAPQVILSLFK
jgi:flagellin